MLRNDGSCIHLNEESTCSIYDSRPYFCRIDDCIELMDLDRNRAYAVTASICNSFMREDGIIGKFVELTIGASSGDERESSEP